MYVPPPVQKKAANKVSICFNIDQSGPISTSLGILISRLACQVEYFTFLQNPNSHAINMNCYKLLLMPVTELSTKCVQVVFYEIMVIMHSGFTDIVRNPFYYKKQYLVMCNFTSKA